MAEMNKWPPLSLAKHFEAPEDHIGEFGWIIGYSANAAFLDDAAERFARQTRGQRAYDGKIRLALMLDPGNPQIALADTPGVLHLPIMRPNEKPFRLLHAKIALLGSRHETEREKWRLRLIVSTGNWTRQTIEESLDLAWVIEIGSDELEGKLDDDVKQRCADFKAAWSLFEYVRQYFDDRIVGEAAAPLQAWLEELPLRRGWSKPRFFDSRSRSLLDQLPELVKLHGNETARNDLSMGSGFYEASEANEVPPVLNDIVKQLREADLLTQTSGVSVFVNPDACQAVANAAEAIKKKGWSIHKAGTPKDFGGGNRTLHAKFLFSANWREGSNNCASAWVYLGSGNLTGPGFDEKMSANGGNLEAGVVFAPEGLQWYPGKNVEDEALVSNLLPVQWESALEDTDVLTPGGDMPERTQLFLAPPVAWLDWKENENGQDGWLMIPEGSETGPFDVLYGDTPCERDGNGFRWLGEQPRQVCIQWGEHRAMAPVRDALGRFGAAKLPALDLTDAWLQLASFPMPPEHEGPDEDPDGDGKGGNGSPRPANKRKANYPIRSMMDLIENIAEKQTAIDPLDWASWLVRLEQTLVQMSACGVLEEFKTLGINPLSPLRQPAFRPNFAETDASEAGRAYEAALAHVEEKWGVAELQRLGVA